MCAYIGGDTDYNWVHGPEQSIYNNIQYTVSILCFFFFRLHLLIDNLYHVQYVFIEQNIIGILLLRARRYIRPTLRSTTVLYSV